MKYVIFAACLIVLLIVAAVASVSLLAQADTPACPDADCVVEWVSIEQVMGGRECQHGPEWDPDCEEWYAMFAMATPAQQAFVDSYEECFELNEGKTIPQVLAQIQADSPDPAFDAVVWMTPPGGDDKCNCFDCQGGSCEEGYIEWLMRHCGKDLQGECGRAGHNPSNTVYLLRAWGIKPPAICDGTGDPTLIIRHFCGTFSLSGSCRKAGFACMRDPANFLGYSDPGPEPICTD